MQHKMTQISLLKVRCQYGDAECILSTSVFLNTGNGHRDGAKRMQFGLKVPRHAISTSRFVIKQTFKGASAYDVASSIAKAMTIELTIDAVANVVGMFMQAFVVLQTTLFLDWGLAVLL